MSGNDPQSRQFVSDWHYTSLSNTAPLDNVLATFQSAFDHCANATPPSGGSCALSPPKSRDTMSSPTPTPGPSHAAWGCLGFSTFANDPLDMGAVGCTATLSPSGDFPGRITQHPSQSKMWGSLFDPQFIRSSAVSNACFFDPILNNFEKYQAWGFDQPSYPAPISIRDDEFSPLVHGDTLQIGEGIFCQQCNLQFPTQQALATHRRDTQHAPYRCRCGTTFARRDILRRHIQSFQPEIFFPCPHCEKRPRAFKRLDHLTQHFRGYHKMDSGGGSRTQLEIESKQFNGPNGYAEPPLEPWD